jgi:hypothetical protein
MAKLSLIAQDLEQIRTLLSDPQEREARTAVLAGMISVLLNFLGIIIVSLNETDLDELLPYCWWIASYSSAVFPWALYPKRQERSYNPVVMWLYLQLFVLITSVCFIFLCGFLMFGYILIPVIAVVLLLKSIAAIRSVLQGLSDILRLTERFARIGAFHKPRSILVRFVLSVLFLFILIARELYWG